MTSGKLSFILVLFLGLYFCIAASAAVGAVSAKFSWPEFMKQHDMTWDQLPQSWKEAPHFGNAMIGSMLYQHGRSGESIRIQIFRADVHDHRDNSYGWTAYSRPRLRIGDFYLKPVGKILKCQWRKDIWNAELDGTIYTDKGEIRIRHFVHAEDMAIVTELWPSAGEVDCRWSWRGQKATTTRSGYPTKADQIDKFAKKYGDHYRKSLKLYRPNPEGKLKELGPISCWVQNLLAGGQYATAWRELKQKNGKRIHLATITNSYPGKTAENEAVENIRRFSQLDIEKWRETHRTWWHNYYKQSFVSIPDKSLESLYWQTIYRLGCNARAGRCYIDTSGLWFQGGSWPYTTTDHNIQVAHWPTYAANRLEIGQELVDCLHANRDALIKSVLPVEWQEDSAFLHITVARDLFGPRNQDKRYYNCVGCLPWTLHNCWLQYRYSMDDAMLRQKIYPLLRRGINFYLHMLKEDSAGKLHLEDTYSPETGVYEDCNFDLALLKWGCQTLLTACQRLKIDDPLIPRWRDILERAIDFPVDDKGFMLGSNQTSPLDHRHGSHLMMVYPLYLVNIEQAGKRKLLETSIRRFMQGKGYPGMRASYSGPMMAAIGNGNATLKELNDLKNDLHPNGLWFGSPCIEVSLSVATVVHEMLIQSWGDKIRVFPAVPDAWKNVTFHNLRTEGAFLISAVRRNGVNQWVRVHSLAGEPCRIEPNLSGEVKADKDVNLKAVAKGVYELDLAKGGEVVLYIGNIPPNLTNTIIP